MKKIILRMNPFASWFSFPWNKPKIIIVAPATLEVLSEHPSNPPPLPAVTQNPNAETQLAACQENWNKLAETEPLNEHFSTNSFWSTSFQEWLIQLAQGRAVLAHVTVWVTGGAGVFFDYPDPEQLSKGIAEYFEKNCMGKDYDEHTQRRRVYRLDEIGHPVFDLAIISALDKSEMKRKQNKYAFFVDESSIKKETEDSGNVKGKKGARGK